MDSIGSRLKWARERKGYTQKSIAHKLGVTNGAISGYERNYRDPDTAILSEMAELYEVSIDWLLGRTENPEAVLSEPSRALIDRLDLSDEEIIKHMTFIVDGQELPEPMIRSFLALVRAARDEK